MPDWKQKVRRRLFRLNLDPAHEAEIVEELAQHLDDVYNRSLRDGLTEAEAKRAAHAELDNAAATLLLVAVAAIASYIPARSATRVNPIIALRYE